MRLAITYDFAQVKDLLSGRAHANTVAAVSKAIRHGLALIEQHHKREEMVRGGSDRAAIADRVTSRTGTLSKSYRIYMERGALEGWYGSELSRARVLEEGGTISAGAKLLTVPADAAKVGVGRGLSARHYPGLCFIPLTGGKAVGMLARVEGASETLTPYFWLLRSVDIPPRRTLARTAAAKQFAIERMIADAAEQGASGHA